MKFVKANLVLVICGAVVLLALIAIYWPLSFVKADVVGKATERLSEANAVSQNNIKMTIPFGKTFTGPPTQAIIDAKKAAQEQVKRQADEIATQAGKDNERNRLAGTAEHPIPLLNGKPEPNFLPDIRREAGANPLGFKEDYNNLYPAWTKQLVGSATIPGVPPVYNDLAVQYDQTQRVNGQSGAPNDPTNDAKNAYIRNEVISRAEKIHMYVDEDALQKEHDWADAPNPPTADQIFVAVIESWLQKDIVDSITALNANAKNVGDAPIKRLERISIGGDGGVPGGIAGGAKGGLFLEPPNLGSASNQGGAPSSTATNGLDPNRTLTGHVGGGTYDTVLVGITIDLDPAYQNRFFDELYRRNNGYTVLDVRTTVVDPFDAASNGYLYGKKQVVRADILVEALFYRSWTVALMPPGIKSGNGVVNGAHTSAPTRGGNNPAPGGGGGSGNGSGWVPPVDNSL